jgi:hypothetical protein
VRSYKTGDQNDGKQVNRYITDGDVAVAPLTVSPAGTAPLR